MKKWIERALNIHPGDLGRGTLLCSCLFLVISSYIIGRVAGAALFLSRFQAKQLAYADISSSVLVALVVAGYVLVARRVALHDLLVGSTLFFASNCALFWALAHYLLPSGLAVPGVLHLGESLWSAGADPDLDPGELCLTTREAKRVFGMVGGGGIAGWIFSGYFSKTIAKTFGTESLLLGMALFLLICTGLIVLIWRSGQVAGGGAHEIDGGIGRTGPRNMFGSMRLVFSSSIFEGHRRRDLHFVFGDHADRLAVSGHCAAVPGEERRSGCFFGDFNFYAGILSLLFQLLVTTRFLRRFGIGTALFVLPVTVLLGSAGLLAFGTLGAVVALKGFDQVQRYSLDKSTVELLYLPLPARIKIQVKWFIDTVVWRLGDGLSGLAVLIFATTLHMAGTSNQLDCAGAGQRLAGGGCGCAQRQYVATLKESISQHRVDVEQASMSVLDRSTAELLATKLSASDPKEILYALSLFEVERQRAAHPVIRSLLSHSSPRGPAEGNHDPVRNRRQDGAAGNRTFAAGSRSQCAHRSFALPYPPCAR